MGDHQRFLTEDRSGMTIFALWKYQSGCSVENRRVGFWSAFRQALDTGERCGYPSKRGKWRDSGTRVGAERNESVCKRNEGQWIKYGEALGDRNW